MSALLLDIGNSRLKWALHDAQHGPAPRLHPVAVGATLGRDAASQAIAHEGAPATALAALAAAWSGPAPRAVYIAQVTGAANGAALAQVVQQAWHCTPQFARSTAECAGLKNSYAEASRLGIDRWLAMLALWSRTQAAFVVASAGTALTVDVVSDTGQHLGGVIAPGLRSMIDTTLGHTRFAVGDMQAHFEHGLGRHTEACVCQGALHAVAGLLDRLGTQHPGPKVLAGGDADTVQPHLSSAWQIKPDLVLQGLAVWAGLASTL